MSQPSESTENTQPSGVSRRSLLRGSAALAGVGVAHQLWSGQPSGAQSTTTTTPATTAPVSTMPSTLVPSTSGPTLVPTTGPGVVRGARPVITHGVQTGDVALDRAILWSRADRPSRMVVEVATTASFRDSYTLLGPVVTPATDFTGKMELRGLPRGQRVVYRVSFEDLSDLTVVSEPLTGSFTSYPTNGNDVVFAWTGDCAGQGWGINPELGGMKCWETIRRQQPQFLINSGDSIYADGVILPEVKDASGKVIWKNLTTPEKSKVAETLDEFRGNYKYNLLDDNVKRCLAEVPMFAQWDDHEVVNNWYPLESLEYRPEYTEKSVATLAARAGQAFHEFMPIRDSRVEPGRVYRKIAYGPLLDVFIIDMRTYRGSNSRNEQSSITEDASILGTQQREWLKRELKKSKATWKVIASDMPIGLVVGDYADGTNPHEPPGAGNKRWFEAVANADNGAASGRELEIADILSFMKRNGIRNTVWLTADVHYTAAHFYNPNKASFTDFDGFWEFVSGPVNSGTFGPNTLDATFGPELKYIKAPAAGQANLPPSAGLQFFGLVRIDNDNAVMTVRLMDVAGATLYSVDLVPVGEPATRKSTQSSDQANVDESNAIDQTEPVPSTTVSSTSVG
jgi:alkaline phosphatase D